MRFARGALMLIYCYKQANTNWEGGLYKVSIESRVNRDDPTDAAVFFLDAGFCIRQMQTHGPHVSLVGRHFTTSRVVSAFYAAIGRTQQTCESIKTHVDLY